MLRSFRQVLAAVALSAAVCATATHAATEELCSLPSATYAAVKATYPAAAFALTELEKHAVTTWYSDRNGDYAATLTQLLKTCSGDKRLSLVVYGMPNKDCEAGYSASGSTVQSAADYVKFLNTLTSSVGDRKALYVLEPDAVGLLAKKGGCGEAAGYRENLKTAIKELSTNPNAEIYLDVGYWTLASADSLARVVAVIKELAEAGTIKGITINTSNYRSNEELSTLCTGFQAAMGQSTYKCIVDTSRNYNEPTSTEWCNVKSAGIGHPPTSETGYSNLDYFMWVKPPGESDGSCDGVHTLDAMQGPAAGKFFNDAFTLLWNQGYFVKTMGMAAIGDSVAPTPAPTTTEPDAPTPSSTSPVQQYPTPEPTTSSPVTIDPEVPTPAPTTAAPIMLSPDVPTPAPTTSSPVTITPDMPTPAPTTSSPMTISPDVPTPAPTSTGSDSITGPTPAPTTTGSGSITGPTPAPITIGSDSITGPTPAPTTTGNGSISGPTPAPTTGAPIPLPTPSSTPCIYIMAGATPTPTPTPASTTGSAISDESAATVMPQVEPTQPLPAPTPASTKTTAVEASGDGDFDIDESSDSGSAIVVPTPAPTSLRGVSDSVGVEYESSSSGDSVKQVSTQSSSSGSGTTVGVLVIVGVIGVVVAIAAYMNSRAKKKMIDEPKETSPIPTNRACEVQDGTYISVL